MYMLRPRPVESTQYFRDRAAHFDMVRCGVAVYGLDPFQEDAAARGLDPVLTLQSYVGAVRRFEVERDDRIAFPDEPGDAERSPCLPQFRGFQALGGLFPTAGHQGVGRPTLLLELPAQRQSAGAEHREPGREAPQPFGPLKSRDLG